MEIGQNVQKCVISNFGGGIIAIRPMKIFNPCCK